MDQKDLNPIALALGIMGALACSSAVAVDNPFSLTELSSDYMIADSHGDEAAEGEAAEGEAAEGEAAEGEAAEGEAAEGEAAEEASE